MPRSLCANVVPHIQYPTSSDGPSVWVLHVSSRGCPAVMASFHSKRDGYSNSPRGSQPSSSSGSRRTLGSHVRNGIAQLGAFMLEEEGNFPPRDGPAANKPEPTDWLERWEPYMPLVVFIIAFVTRYYRLMEPPGVVFDEVRGVIQIVFFALPFPSLMACRELSCVVYPIPCEPT